MSLKDCKPGDIIRYDEEGSLFKLVRQIRPDEATPDGHRLACARPGYVGTYWWIQECNEEGTPLSRKMTAHFIGTVTNGGDVIDLTKYYSMFKRGGIPTGS